jgi:hypothetical protein
MEILEVEVTLRLTVSQYVFGVESTLELVIWYYFLSERCCLISVGRLLSREDGSAVCSVIIQWSESHTTRSHTLLSHLRLHQPDGPGSRICIPQEQDGPVIPLDTVFLLCLLLRLTELRWNYSDTPQTGGPGPRTYSYIYPSGTEWSSPKSK